MCVVLIVIVWWVLTAWLNGSYFWVIFSASCVNRWHHPSINFCSFILLASKAQKCPIRLTLVVHEKLKWGTHLWYLFFSDCFEPWFPSATVMWYCTHLNESEDSWILTAWSLTVWSSPSRDAPFLNTLNLVIGTLDTRKLIGTVLKEDFLVPLVVQRPERLNSFSWATPHALLEKTELYLKSFFPLFCPNILGNSSWPLLNSVLV